MWPLPQNRANPKCFYKTKSNGSTRSAVISYDNVTVLGKLQHQFLSKRLGIKHGKIKEDERDAGNRSLKLLIIHIAQIGLHLIADQNGLRTNHHYAIRGPKDEGNAFF